MRSPISAGWPLALPGWSRPSAGRGRDVADEDHAAGRGTSQGPGINA